MMKEAEQSVIFCVAGASEGATLGGNSHVFIIPEDETTAQSATGDGRFDTAADAAPTVGGIVGVYPVIPELIVFVAYFFSRPLAGSSLSLMPQRYVGS